MIATTLFSFGTCSTFRTINKVGTTFSILKEFFFVFVDSGLLLTGISRMPFHATLEAHLKTACAHRWLAAFPTLLNVADAAWSGTPAQRGVQIHNYILMEL